MTVVDYSQNQSASAITLPLAVESHNTMSSSIPGLRFGEFQGLPALLISTPFSKAAVSLFGGHVLSFVPTGFDDVLFMSPTTKRPPDPLRGGIPVCLSLIHI